MLNSQLPNFAELASREERFKEREAGELVGYILTNRLDKYFNVAAINNDFGYKFMFLTPDHLNVQPDAVYLKDEDNTLVVPTATNMYYYIADTIKDCPELFIGILNGVENKGEFHVDVARAHSLDSKDDEERNFLFFLFLEAAGAKTIRDVEKLLIIGEKNYMKWLVETAPTADDGHVLISI